MSKKVKLIPCEHGAPSEADCRRIAKLIEKWKRVLRLDAHTIAISYEGRDLLDDDERADRQADAQSGWPYREHYIRIFPAFFENDDKEGQDIAILHELVHLIFGEYDTLLHRAQEGRTPTDDTISDAAESTTDWITRVLWVLINPKAKIHSVGTTFRKVRRGEGKS